MRRFFVDGPFNAGAIVDIQGDEFHHLVHVSRLQEKERVELLDGKGQVALAQISSISKKQASLEILQVQKLPPPSIPRVELILSIPRFQKMDVIIQKSVELGAHALSPVVSDRSFVRNLSKDLDGKMRRWEKIALEACKQSGRAWPLGIRPVAPLDELVKARSQATGLFLYEGEGQLDIKAALSKMQRPEDVTVFIGSEGGFSLEEVQSFKERGFQPVTMGPLVLRVETACIALLSVIQYHFDQMR